MLRVALPKNVGALPKEVKRSWKRLCVLRFSNDSIINPQSSKRLWADLKSCVVLQVHEGIWICADETFLHEPNSEQPIITPPQKAED